MLAWVLASDRAASGAGGVVVVVVWGLKLHHVTTSTEAEMLCFLPFGGGGLGL